MNDYYTTLGIDRNATQEDIKKAFRKLAHKHHPDKQGGDEKKFKEINSAYQVLSNKQKRAQYDQFGKTFEYAGNSGAGFDFNSFWQGRGQQGFGGAGINLDDILENVFNFGGRSRAGTKDLNKGADLQFAVEIELESAFTGVNQDLYLRKMEYCERCDSSGAEPGTKVKECFSCRGTGQVQQMKRTILGTFTTRVICPECEGQGKIPEKPCNVCKGEGRVEQEQALKASIPAGVDTGQVIKLAGKGDAGRIGGKQGDLYLKIFVKEHPIFDRKGDDIYMTLPIAFSEAVLGGEVEAPTLDKKKLALKVPQGTQSGKIVRISGKGIPHFTGWGKGNMFVQFVVQTPQKPNKKQKELIRKLQSQGL